jgi:hypothetical protein
MENEAGAAGVSGAAPWQALKPFLDQLRGHVRKR